MAFLYRTVVTLVIIFTSYGCSKEQQELTSEQLEVNAIADTFLSEYFTRYPEKATYFGVNEYGHSGLTNQDLQAYAKWQLVEDKFLEQINNIDVALLKGTPEYYTLNILKESIEASQEERVCKSELWGISPLTGWQAELADLASKQPISSVELKEQALLRWQQLPEFIDKKIENLRTGIKAGYTAPKALLPIIIKQLDKLLEGNIEDSPFFIPKDRKAGFSFYNDFTKLVANKINPAIKKYREFLATEYMPQARDTIGVGSLPNGNKCYAAKVRAFATISVPAAKIHQLGLIEVDKLKSELRAIADKHFSGLEPQELLQHVKSKQYCFDSEQAILDFNLQGLNRAKGSLAQYFNLPPIPKIEIKPYPQHRAATGAPGEYHPPAKDGSRPGEFLINTYKPAQNSRVDKESTLFHEAIPGHHLQMSVAKDANSHPVAYYTQLWNTGYLEGWALYAERLADEMGLYSSELDRVGMISNALVRASRLVVDPGLHVLGWSRQQAIDYMLKNTALNEDIIKGEVDRYISLPGQATGYTLGLFEMLKLRKMAEDKDNFGIKEFHTEILKEGAMPLTLLNKKISQWLSSH